MNGYTITSPDGSSKGSFLSLPIEKVQSEACSALKLAGDGYKAFVHNHLGHAVICFVNEKGTLLPRNPVAFPVARFVYG